jgi:molecular chaperone DnaJ
MSTDYYAALGVDKKATKAEIKKAFRAKAKKHHPDKGGDEAEFKKINQAYETLSNEQKRAQYDQFGSAGAQFGGSGGAGGGGFSAENFGGFEDIFSSFFGGGGGQGRRTSSKTRGSDLEVEVNLSFDESIRGIKKTFTSRHYQACETCSAKGGEGRKSCSTCQGQGTVAQQFQTPFGKVQQQTTCPTCRGEGSSFETNCKKCGGEGRHEGKINLEVDIPAGIADGETLRVPAKGEAGRRGAGAGDLYVHIRVASSSKWQRRGFDLISSLNISVFDAVLGGEFPVETFWGKVDLKVPENTPDRQMLRIRGKGVQGSGQTGDHLVRIEYDLPKKISKKLRELLEQAKKAA